MNDQNEDVPKARITVYVREKEHKKLKAKLALEGISMSEWFRRLMQKELKE